MNTGYKDLDEIIDLNKPQLLMISDTDGDTEVFLLNLIKNITVDQNIPTLLFDDNIRINRDKEIQMEREVLFDNKEHEISIDTLMFDVSDYTLDVIAANYAMLDFYKLTENRLVEGILNSKEIEEVKENNKINLIEILDGKKYNFRCNLFSENERKLLSEADKKIKESLLYLSHIKNITIKDFKEICYKYKKDNEIKFIVLNDINLIEKCNKKELLKQLQELAKELEAIIFVSEKIIHKDIISLENEINRIQENIKFIDTIIFLKKIGEDVKELKSLYIIRNINKKLGKVELLYLKDYCKYTNLEKIN